MGFCCGCYCLKESINNKRAGIHIIIFLPLRIQNIPGERGGGEKKEKGWPVFGDKGPEAFISPSVKQHTLALIVVRALRALRVI